MTFVAGAAGIGKTALLETGRFAGVQAGFRVASAVGSAMEMGLPFGLIGQTIVALGGSEIDDPVVLAQLGGQLGPAVPDVSLADRRRGRATIAAGAR